MKISKHWKSIGILSFVMVLGVLASCSRQLATVPTIPATPTSSPTITKTFTPLITNTFTYTPTFTFSNTPCLAGGNTCTMTLTFTSTNTPTGPTATPTGTPSTAIPFENFTDTGYPAGGAPWSGSPEPAYLTDNYQGAGTAVTFNLDPTTFVSGPNSMKMQIGFSGPSTLAQAGFNSGYAQSNNYGGPISIEATAAAHPTSLSLWLLFSTAATVEIFIRDNLGTQSYYQNNTGATYEYPVPSGVWTNLVLPLDATGHWDANFPFLDWTQMLLAGGIVVQPGATTNMQVNWDDIYFYP